MHLVSHILFITIALVVHAAAIRIGSFNLRQYGTKKAANELLTKVVAEIISDFDLAIIQEITDVTLTSPFVLHEALNRVSSANPYTMTLSPRVGRSATKEQYIFYNREALSGIQLVNSYVYEDPLDLFERPPFIGTFKVKKPGQSGVKLFSIMNVHLRPDAAYKELLSMRHVIEDFILQNPQYFDQTAASLTEALEQNVIDATPENIPSLKTNHPILIIGDFNADCKYISPTRQNILRAIDFADFHWIINNEVKTNTLQTCTYDRILINGDNFVNAIVPNSNTTVNFPATYNMTLKEAVGVSDHIPIKFDIEW